MKYKKPKSKTITISKDVDKTPVPRKKISNKFTKSPSKAHIEALL